MKIISVVGARPNFMKIAPFCRAIQNLKGQQSYQPASTQVSRLEHMLVHTGQHYDTAMSGSFFESLGIPKPDFNLEVGSGSHAEQVGRTMIAFENVVRSHCPDWIVVVGDVNATLACSITAKKEGVKLAHIEAGLRSFDMGMPEEINRIVTDRLSDLLFTTDRIASENLEREGVSRERIEQVGNIMIDTLQAQRRAASGLRIEDIIEQNWHRENRKSVRFDSVLNYSVITLHRPSNVDYQAALSRIVQFLTDEVSDDSYVLWPMHPRTKKRLEQFGLWADLCVNERILLLYPLGYVEFLRLNMSARMMITDSGGLQEECCVLGTPCLTLRWNTERPITLMEHGGASLLAGNELGSMCSGYRNLRALGRLAPFIPPGWDGKAAHRIARILANGEVRP